MSNIDILRPKFIEFTEAIDVVDTDGVSKHKLSPTQLQVTGFRFPWHLKLFTVYTLYFGH